MRRLILLLLALAAVPPVLCAQSSQFGVRGLGLPGRQQSARAMGSAGAFAFFDGESSVSPASIGYLGQLEKNFGVPLTTRNWNTISAIVRILKNQPTDGTVKGAGQRNR